RRGASRDRSASRARVRRQHDAWHALHRRASPLATDRGNLGTTVMTETLKPSVLVVDDETGILDSLNILLRNEGFAPHLAHGGKAGLDRMSEVRPDIVLTDIRMPNVSG